MSGPGRKTSRAGPSYPQEGQFLLDDVLGNRDRDELASGTPQDWTNVAHDIAVQAYVEPGDTIDRDYIEEHQPQVDEQLLRAGLRLARLIEEALGGAN